MATLSARGSHMVWQLQKGNHRIALRSDGTLLTAHVDGGRVGSWSRYGLLTHGVTAAQSQAAYAGRGYSLVKQGYGEVTTATDLKARLSGHKAATKPGAVTSRYASPEAELAALRAENNKLASGTVATETAAPAVATVETPKPQANTGAAEAARAMLAELDSLRREVKDWQDMAATLENERNDATAESEQWQKTAMAALAGWREAVALNEAARVKAEEQRRARIAKLNASKR